MPYGISTTPELDWWNHLDAAWKQVFKQALDLTGDSPDADAIKQIWALKELTLPGDHNYRHGITSLEPLRKLSNLEKLDCSFNEIRSLAPLQPCRQLRSLACRGNPIVSLAAIIDYGVPFPPKLEYLDASHTLVFSLKPLKALTLLRFLDISHTPVRSLEPLSLLKYLEVVHYTQTPAARLYKIDA
jgi:Leucine-rich repeat (LRR) protein